MGTVFRVKDIAAVNICESNQQTVSENDAERTLYALYRTMKNSTPRQDGDEFVFDLGKGDVAKVQVEGGNDSGGYITMLRPLYMSLAYHFAIGKNDDGWNSLKYSLVEALSGRWPGDAVAMMLGDDGSTRLSVSFTFGDDSPVRHRR